MELIYSENGRVFISIVLGNLARVLTTVKYHGPVKGAAMVVWGARLGRAASFSTLSVDVGLNIVNGLDDYVLSRFTIDIANDTAVRQVGGVMIVDVVPGMEFELRGVANAADLLTLEANGLTVRVI
jgi:hypothetical protein